MIELFTNEFGVVIWRVVTDYLRRKVLCFALIRTLVITVSQPLGVKIGSVDALLYVDILFNHCVRHDFGVELEAGIDCDNRRAISIANAYGDDVISELLGEEE